MRRKRKRRKRLSVSLFPFLAVLICTLGVLIIMLVMAVKSADDQATAAQTAEDEQHQARLDELESAMEVRSLQIEGLTAVRPDVLERMRLSRANFSYLKDEIRKLKDKFKRVGEELAELEQPLDDVAQPVASFSEVESTTELESIRSKLLNAKAELKSKREAAKETGPTNYVIVPHKGGGGTFRRPIFIECVKDEIILQPAGIRLRKSDFAPPLQPGNMLDAALLATREYWQRYDIAGEEGNPYPLIVVRPDGSETFVLARRAMKSWDDEFGYELVESDKQLDFGESDPQLKTELEEAIRVAKQQQQQQQRRVAQEIARRKQLARFASRGSNDRDSRPGLTVSGPRGGFVSNVGTSSGSQAGGFDGSDDSFVQSASGQTEDRNRNNGIQAQSGNESSQGQTSAVASANGSQSNQSSKSGEGGDGKIQNPYADLSVAKQRGAGWALPTRTPGATGYLRPVGLICGADFLEVHSFDGVKKRIPMRGETAEAIDQLVDELWRQIESWGISGENSYWKPQLRVQILDGGQQRFLQLKGLLYRSGLAIEGSKGRNR